METPKPPDGYPQLFLWPAPALKAAEVSQCVQKKLFIHSGEQTLVVVAAYVAKRNKPPSITVTTVVHSVLGDWQAVNFSYDDNSNSMDFIKLPSEADMEKFHDHGWRTSPSSTSFFSMRVVGAIKPCL